MTPNAPLFCLGLGELGIKSQPGSFQASTVHTLLSLYTLLFWFYAFSDLCLSLRLLEDMKRLHGYGD